MFDAKVTIDLTQFHELVGRTQARMITTCEIVANEGADEVVEHAQSQPHFKNRTGRLYRSIAVVRRAQFSGRKAIASVAAGAPHARWVEWGTDPHPIVARKKPNLIFWWERENVLFIGKRVNHPGSSGRYFMSRGARRAHYAMIRRLEQEAKRLGNIWR